MYKMLKRKEKEPLEDGAVIILLQNKVDKPSRHKDIKMCYYYSKPRHIARFCTKQRTKIKKKNTNNMKDDDDYIFIAQHGACFKAMCKWIMDLGAMKHDFP